jgi:hypothetical protein
VRKLAEAVMVVLTVVLGQPMLGAHGWDQFRRHAQIIRTLTRRSPAPAAQSAGKAFALWDGRVAVVPGHRCSRAAGLDTG